MDRMPTWMQLEHECVCGPEAYHATEPKLDALAQPDEAAGIASRVSAITREVLTTNQRDFLPSGSTAASSKEFMDNVHLGVDRGLTFVAVPPEALEVPERAVSGDAAGLQIHIRPGDVVIPVDETGSGIAQVMFTALMDVAREANRMDMTSCELETRTHGSVNRYASVTSPHGATGAFDPQIAVDAATAVNIARETATARDGVPRIPEMGVIDAAWSMSHEAVTDELLRFTHAPRAVQALDDGLRRVLGHGAISRAGSDFCTTMLGSGSPVMRDRQRALERAMSADAAASLHDLRAVAANQRALREFASATIYSANYLRNCCLGVSDDATAFIRDIPSDARVVFVASGGATATVVRRIVEVSTRFTQGLDTLLNYAGLHRIAVVALPSAAMERRLEAAVSAAAGAERGATAAAGAASSSAAVAAAARGGSAVASLVHGTPAGGAAAAGAPAAAGVDAAIIHAYRALTRVFRAKIPRAWLHGGAGPLDGMGAEFLWSTACAEMCG